MTKEQTSKENNTMCWISVMHFSATLVYLNMGPP